MTRRRSRRLAGREEAAELTHTPAAMRASVQKVFPKTEKRRMASVRFSFGRVSPKGRDACRRLMTRLRGTAEEPPKLTADGERRENAERTPRGSREAAERGPKR